jgi:DNA-binding MarR family transcriptional regulator
LPNLNVAHIFNAMLKVSDPPPRRAASEERATLADGLLDELSRWGPRERAGMLRTWHRGSLSLVHLMVLNLLEAEGPQSMGGLAEALDVSVASATGIVNRMERRGLVERERGEVDRRLILVSLTPAGAAVFSEMSARRGERLTRLVGALTDRQIAGLLEGLRAMHAAGERLFGREAEAGPVGPAVGDHPTAGRSDAQTKDRPR